MGDGVGRELGRDEDGIADEVVESPPGERVTHEAADRADRRGDGLAISGMAAVAELVRREIPPVVSLYVNEWNAPARATYARVGFEQTATFATLMF